MMTPTDEDKAQSGGNKRMSLLDLTDYCVAHSMMAFLLADIRKISALGYIRTKFEHLCIDSDVNPRLSARDMAGFGDLPSLGDEIKEKTSGVTAAHMMALLLVEITQESEEASALKKDKAPPGLLNLTPTEQFRKDVKAANSLPALFRCYNHMLSADVADDIPHVSKDEYPLSQPKNASDTGQLKRADFDPHVSDVEADDRSENMFRLSFSGRFGGRPGLPSFVMNNAVGSRRMSLDLRPSALRRESEIMQQQVEQMVNLQHKFLNESSLPADSERFYNAHELKVLIDQAIESREFWKLGFMQTFFKEGTVSGALARSRTETVWLNDWYEQYQLTYAISINREEKRVTLAFRGAYTKSDWKHIFKWYDTGTSNPIKEDYPNKPKVRSCSNYPSLRLIHALPHLSLHRSPHLLTKSIRFHEGFHAYLFRVRKDTETTKVGEDSRCCS